ncbi:regulator of DNA class I crossover intermediates 1 [Melanerpes formicivorus]|uniref:regulator of DNA class I crossover intermediates 1 n=1 Tax=Melanerpes formicivorus TaxID=211600 RepID=UPI00358E4837
MRKPVHIAITERAKTCVRRHNIELPTSPQRTKHLSNLDDIQNRLQKQVLDSRRQHLAEKVKCQHSLSQVTELKYDNSSMDHGDNTARTFSACPLSSSGFWSSDCTQLSEENFNTDRMDSASEQTCEKKQQNQPGNNSDQDIWTTKPPSQCILKKSDTVPLDMFKPLHRLLYVNSARKNPVIMTSNKSETSEGLKEPVFDIVKETAEAPQDGNDCSFLALFEDESQLMHNNLSTNNFNPFVNESNAAIFLVDPDDRHQMTNRNYLYHTREAYPAINAKPHFVDRHLEGIFTAPEQVLFKSNNVSSVRDKITVELHHLQGQHYVTASERKEKPAKLEKLEAFAYRHDQQINVKENGQTYSRKKSDDESVKESKEPAWRLNQLFQFEEFTTAQEKKSMFEMTSKLHEMQKGVESSLNSQHPIYNSRQTESCFSCSPDRSEVEDTAKKKEYLNDQPLKTDANLASASASTEPSRPSHTRTVPLQPSNILTPEEASRLQEKVSISCATKEENKTHAAPPEGISLHQALKREHVTHSTWCDGWSQTERSVTEVRKVDVATQCGTMQICNCGSSLPSACSPGRVPPRSIAGTTRGHKMPAHEDQQPVGMGSMPEIEVFASEAEYLSLAGRRTLEVLNYIDTMKERGKQ